MEQTLVLNASYEPLKVVDWQRAITLWCQGKVEIVESHEREARSVSFTIKLPSVVRLLQMVRLKKRQVVAFTRANIYARDEMTCQYCTSPEAKILTSNLVWKTAGEVQIGDELVGVDERRPGKGQWRKVRASVVTNITRFSAPRLKVVTGAGEILVSYDHQFLAREKGRELKWVPALNIHRGMVIKYLADPWVDRSDSWLAGLIDGEGSLDAKRGRLTVAQNDGRVLDRLKAELRAGGIKFSTSLVNKHKSDKCRAVSVSRLSDILLLLGSYRPTRISPDGLLTGHLGLGSDRDVEVLSVETAGSGPLIGITTTTATLITDGYVSHNCAEKFRSDELTFDHVLPASRGGIRDWHNIVTSCEPCNRRKANRTPEEAGMKLIHKPRRPQAVGPMMKVTLGWKTPENWHSYLYWNVELERR